MTNPTGGVPPPGGAPPPTTPAVPTTGAPVGAANYAEWWKRAVAGIIDGIIIGIINAILSIPLGGLFTVTQPSVDATTGQINFGPGFFTAWAAGNILWLVIDLVYYIYFHGNEKAQTPGKMVMKLQLRDDATGGAPGYGKAAIRTVVAIVLAFACGLPYLVSILWPLWDSKKQTLHDKAAGTVVIDIG